MKFNPILYIKITITKNINNIKELKLYISDKYHLYKKEIVLNLPYPLEIINGISDEVIIPVFKNGIINYAYIKYAVYNEVTSKEEIIKEYLDIPNIFLFKGVNYISKDNENLIIEIGEKL